MTLSIEAYHGTSAQAAIEIEAATYKESYSESEWLGRGVYFFVDGISDPLTDAKAWAKAQAWDKTTKRYRYEQYSVLRSTIVLDPDKVIDLTNQLGLRLFNDIKSKFLDKIYDNFSFAELRKMEMPEHNCAVFNYIAATLKAHAVLHHLYIKNTTERKLHMRLTVPNTTVLCVKRTNFNFGAVIVHKGNTNES
ncbi:hypothetical protein [Massilia scottii]|uniref:hypothetical protein n=1 Tax=Massilia scottii TaxID=3057166 RepID=UPI002796A96F|nr:hypothetical protein [Massilia sp. CCM 9029]MDQ1834677.1 hypothetical protein [Massilia sp. CCM 9029]